MGKKGIKASSAKGKGRRLQNWAAERISEVLGIPWGREDDSLIEPRQMGQSGVDVILRGEARKLFPFDCECKNTERMNLGDAVTQARKNTQEGRSWLLIMKRNSLRDPVVVLDAKVFFRLFGVVLKYAEILKK